MSHSRYAEAWRELERRESRLRIFAVLLQLTNLAPVFFAGLLFGLAYLLLDALGIDSLPIQVIGAVFVVTASLTALAWYRYSFRCPRCGKLFFIRNRPHSLSVGDGKQCVHCQLRAGDLEN